MKSLDNEIGQSIPERFEEVVKLIPDRVAIQTTTAAIAYGELDAQANGLANALFTRSGELQERVAVLVDDLILLGVASMAVVKAGKICVNIDPCLPGSRIDYILKETQSSLILTDAAGELALTSAAGGSYDILRLTLLERRWAAARPPIVLAPEYIADIAYTSGSTGRPKGIIRTHGFIIGKRHDRLARNLSGKDAVRRTIVSSSRNTVLAGLLDGIESYPWDIRKDGLTGLPRWLRNNRITHYQSSPSVFRQFVGGLRATNELAELRSIRLSGEVVTKHDVKLFKAHFSPNCVLHISLGTTESGGIAQRTIDKDTVLDSTIVPVGFEVPNKTILLLDDGFRDVGCNQVGRIAVKSRYLAAGYWAQPDLTRTSFIADPDGSDQRIFITGDLGRRAADGSLEYLGREDDQVKIRGLKVEPAEIVTRFLDHEAVQDAFVLPKKDQVGEMQLLAYIVLKEGMRASVTELRRFLRETLPEYMIPSSHVFLPALPLTATFKVDRASLPAPGRDRPDLDTPYAAPQTPLEEALANIWSEVLSLNQTGRTDNFFDLGGNSLAASRVLSRLANEFNLEIPLRALFESPTIADMAAVIAEHQKRRLQTDQLENLLTEVESLSDEQALGLSTLDSSTNNKHSV